MRFSSSPPRGPCSTSHNSPLGENAIPYGVRTPLAQVSAGVRLGPGKVYVLTTFAVLAASVSRGGSIRGILAAPVLPALGLPGAGLPSSVRRRILPTG